MMMNIGITNVEADCVFTIFRLRLFDFRSRNIEGLSPRYFLPTLLGF